MGEWSRARGHFQQSEALTRNLGFSLYSQYYMVEIAEFRLDEGRVDDVRVLAEEALVATVVNRRCRVSRGIINTPCPARSSLRDGQSRRSAAYGHFRAIWNSRPEW